MGYIRFIYMLNNKPIIKKTKQKKFLRGIAQTLILCLFIQEFAYAAPELLKKDMGSWVSGASQKQKNLNWAKKLLPYIPESVATIDDAYFAGHGARGTGHEGDLLKFPRDDDSAWRISRPAPRAPSTNKVVILIQDAHTNASAQMNESKLFDILFQSNMVDTVYTEAAKGNVNLTFLRDKASLNKRKQIAKAYLQKGILHGIEYLDLTSEHDFKIEGVEDPALYYESIDVYRESLKERDGYKAYLGKIESTINVLKPKLLNPYLLEFLESYTQVQKEVLSFSSYIDILFAQAQLLNISLKDSPNLQKLKSLKAIEDKIDFDQASREQQEAIQSLKSEDQDELGNLSTSKVSLKDSQRGFFALLTEKLNRVDGGLSNYPNLAKYLRYLEQSKDLRLADTLHEQKLLEENIFTTLSTNADESKLLLSLKVLQFYKKLFLLSLTPEEYEAFKNENFANIKVLTGFLNQKLMDLKGHYNKALFLKEDFSDMVTLSKRFYELTYARDQKFLENINASLSVMHSQESPLSLRSVGTQESPSLRDARSKRRGNLSPNTSILITGGYHTPNLKHLLKQNNISYISVTPQVTHETNTQRYEQILLNQPITNFVLPTMNTIAPKHAMNPYLAPNAEVPSVFSNRFLSEFGVDRQVAGQVRMAAKDSGPVKGKRRTGVSKWDILEQFNLDLETLPESVVTRLAEETSLGGQRRILVNAGLKHTVGIDGKFLSGSLKRFLQKRNTTSLAEDLRRHHLRHEGVGRHLIAYSADDFDFVLKMPRDPNKAEMISKIWIGRGYQLAEERLNGLAVDTFVVDVEGHSDKPFNYVLEKSGAQKASLAIIQQKVVPVFARLKQLAAEDKIDEAKALIDQYKEFVVAMFKRGVMDFDFTYPYGNYGVNPKTGQIQIFDFGDIEGDENDSMLFLQSINKTNKYFSDDLESQVDKRVAVYFRRNPIKPDDFYTAAGLSLFGVDLNAGKPDDFKMTFPYTESRTRAMFMNHNVTLSPSDRIENSGSGVRMAKPSESVFGDYDFPSPLIGVMSVGSRLYLGSTKVGSEQHFVKLPASRNFAQVIAREAELIRALKSDARISPLIPDVIQSGAATQDDVDALSNLFEGEPYIILKKADGISVINHIESMRDSDRPVEAIEVLAQIAQALATLHSPADKWQAVYHRDLKPTDIFVNKQDSAWTVQFVDWGLSTIEDQASNSFTQDFSENALSDVDMGASGHRLDHAGTNRYSGTVIGNPLLRDLRSFASIVSDYADILGDNKAGHLLDDILAAKSSYPTAQSYVEVLQKFLRENTHSTTSPSSMASRVESPIDNNQVSNLDSDAVRMAEIPPLVVEEEAGPNLIIADDFTGAFSIASGIRNAYGQPAIVVGDIERLAESGVSSDSAVVLDTRAASFDDVTIQSRNRDLIKKIGKDKLPDIKIDYALRNLRHALAGLIDSIDYDLMFFVPGMPSLNTKTEQGSHWIQESGVWKPVHESQVAKQSRRPLNSSSVAKLLWTELGIPEDRILLIPKETVELGSEAIIEFIQSKNPKKGTVIIPDVIKNEDHQSLAQATITLGTQKDGKIERVLRVGNSDFLRALMPQNTTQALKIPWTALQKPGAAIAVIGTINPVTNTQVDLAKQNMGDNLQIITLDVDAILHGGLDSRTVADTRTQLITSLKSQQPVVLQTARASRSFAPGQEALISRALAEVLNDYEVTSRVTGLFISGGETVGSVSSQLNADGVVAKGEFAEKIPWGTFSGGLFDGVPVVTKQGNNNIDPQVVFNFFKRSRGISVTVDDPNIKTQTFSQVDTTRQWEQIKDSPELVYDTLIVGGGAAGAGALRDLAIRGNSNLILIDKGDFAGATSSKSGKAIHPGLWYLRMTWQHLLLAFKIRREDDPKKRISFGANISAALGNLKLVWGGTRERKALVKTTDGIVEPLPHLALIYKDSPDKLWQAMLGIAMYELFSILWRGKFGKTRYYFNPKQVSKDFPHVNTDGLEGAVLYWDAKANNDKTLVAKTIRDAYYRGTKENPVYAMSHVLLDSWQWSEEEQLFLVDLKNEYGEIIQVKSRTLTNAAGAWIDKVRQQQSGVDIQKTKIVKFGGGSQVEFTNQFINEQLNAAGQEILQTALAPLSKKRRYFFRAYLNNGIWFIRLGSTDRGDKKPDAMYPSEDEVKELVDAYNEAVSDPRWQITPQDVYHADSGIRPLVKPSSDGGDLGNLSREFHIQEESVGESGNGIILHMIGVKLTEMRWAGEVVGAKLKKFLAKQGIKLGKSTTKTTPYLAVQGEESFALQDGVYPHGDLEFIKNRIAHLINYQMLSSFKDYMLHQGGLRDAMVFNDQGKPVIDESNVRYLHEVMANMLGWNAQKRISEWNNFWTTYLKNMEAVQAWSASRMSAEPQTPSDVPATRMAHPIVVTTRIQKAKEILEKVERTRTQKGLVKWVKKLEQLQGSGIAQGVEDVFRYGKGDDKAKLESAKRLVRLFHVSWRADGSPEGVLPKVSVKGNKRARDALLRKYPAERIENGIRNVQEELLGPSGEGEAPVVNLSKKINVLREFEKDSGIGIDLIASIEYKAHTNRRPTLTGSFKRRQFINFFLENIEKFQLDNPNRIKQVFINSSGNAIQGLLFTVKVLKDVGLLPEDFTVVMVAHDNLDPTKEKKIKSKYPGHFKSILFIGDFIKEAKELGGVLPEDKTDKELHKELENINALLDYIDLYVARYNKKNPTEPIAHVLPSNGESMALGGASIARNLRDGAKRLGLGEIDTLIEPLGGGGPIAGAGVEAYWYKEKHGHDTKVVGVTSNITVSALADGMAIQAPQSEAMAVQKALGSEAVAFERVPEKFFYKAWIDLQDAGFDAEPTSAASLAYIYWLMSDPSKWDLLRHEDPNKKKLIAFMLSGSNYSPETLAHARNVYAQEEMNGYAYIQRQSASVTEATRMTVRESLDALRVSVEELESKLERRVEFDGEADLMLLNQEIGELVDAISEIGGDKASAAVITALFATPGFNSSDVLEVLNTEDIRQEKLYQARVQRLLLVSRVIKVWSASVVDGSGAEDLLLRALKLVNRIHDQLARVDYTNKILHYHRAAAVMTMAAVLSDDSIMRADLGTVYLHADRFDEAEDVLAPLVDELRMNYSMNDKLARRSALTSFGYLKLEQARIEKINFGRVTSKGAMGEATKHFQKAHQLLMEAQRSLRLVASGYLTKSDAQDLRQVPRALSGLAAVLSLHAELYLERERKTVEQKDVINAQLEALGYAVGAYNSSIQAIGVRVNNQTSIDHTMGLREHAMEKVRDALTELTHHPAGWLIPSDFKKYADAINQLGLLLTRDDEANSVRDGSLFNQIQTLHEPAEELIRVYTEVAKDTPFKIVEIANKDFFSAKDFYQALETVMTRQYGDQAKFILSLIFNELDLDILDILIIKWYAELNDVEKRKPGLELVEFISAEWADITSRPNLEITSDLIEKRLQENSLSSLPLSWPTLEAIAEPEVITMKDISKKHESTDYSRPGLRNILVNDQRRMNDVKEDYALIMPWLAVEERRKYNGYFEAMNTRWESFESSTNIFLADKNARQKNGLRHLRDNADGKAFIELGYDVMRQTLESKLNEFEPPKIKKRIDALKKQVIALGSEVNAAYVKYGFTWLGSVKLSLDQIAKEFNPLLDIQSPDYLSKVLSDELEVAALHEYDQVVDFLKHHQDALESTYEALKALSTSVTTFATYLRDSTSDVEEHDLKSLGLKADESAQSQSASIIEQRFADIKTRFEGEAMGFDFESKREALIADIKAENIHVQTMARLKAKTHSLLVRFRATEREMWSHQVVEEYGSEGESVYLSDQAKDSLHSIEYDIRELDAEVLNYERLGDYEQRLMELSRRAERVIEVVKSNSLRLKELKSHAILNEIEVLEDLMHWIYNRIIEGVYSDSKMRPRAIETNYEKALSILLSFKESLQKAESGSKHLKVNFKQAMYELRDVISDEIISGAEKQRTLILAQAIETLREMKAASKKKGGLNVFVGIGGISIRMTPGPFGYPIGYEMVLYDRDKNKRDDDASIKIEQYIRDGFAKIPGLEARLQGSGAEKFFERWKALLDGDNLFPHWSVITSADQLFSFYVDIYEDNEGYPIADLLQASNITLEFLFDGKTPDEFASAQTIFQKVLLTSSQKDRLSASKTGSNQPLMIFLRRYFSDTMVRFFDEDDLAEEGEDEETEISSEQMQTTIGYPGLEQAAFDDWILRLAGSLEGHPVGADQLTLVFTKHYQFLRAIEGRMRRLAKLAGFHAPRVIVENEVRMVVESSLLGVYKPSNLHESYVKNLLKKFRTVYIKTSLAFVEWAASFESDDEAGGGNNGGQAIARDLADFVQGRNLVFYRARVLRDAWGKSLLGKGANAATTAQSVQVAMDTEGPAAIEAIRSLKHDILGDDITFTQFKLLMSSRKSSRKEAFDVFDQMIQALPSEHKSTLKAALDNTDDTVAGGLRMTALDSIEPILKVDRDNRLEIIGRLKSVGSMGLVVEVRGDQYVMDSVLQENTFLVKPIIGGKPQRNKVVLKFVIESEEVTNIKKYFDFRKQLPTEQADPSLDIFANILSVYDRGVDVVVMEYVDGPSLYDVDNVEQQLEQLSSVLKIMHMNHTKFGVFHGEPDGTNIIRDQQGALRLIDLDDIAVFGQQENIDEFNISNKYQDIYFAGRTLARIFRVNYEGDKDALEDDLLIPGAEYNPEQFQHKISFRFDESKVPQGIIRILKRTLPIQGINAYRSLKQLYSDLDNLLATPSWEKDVTQVAIFKIGDSVSPIEQNWRVGTVSRLDNGTVWVDFGNGEPEGYSNNGTGLQLTDDDLPSQRPRMAPLFSGEWLQRVRDMYFVSGQAQEIGGYFGHKVLEVGSPVRPYVDLAFDPKTKQSLIPGTDTSLLLVDSSEHRGNFHTHPNGDIPSIADLGAYLAIGMNDMHQNVIFTPNRTWDISNPEALRDNDQYPLVNIYLQLFGQLQGSPLYEVLSQLSAQAPGKVPGPKEAVFQALLDIYFDGQAYPTIWREVAGHLGFRVTNHLETTGLDATEPSTSADSIWTEKLEKEKSRILNREIFIDALFNFYFDALADTEVSEREMTAIYIINYIRKGLKDSGDDMLSNYATTTGFEKYKAIFSHDITPEFEIFERSVKAGILDTILADGENLSGLRMTKPVLNSNPNSLSARMAMSTDKFKELFAPFATSRTFTTLYNGIGSFDDKAALTPDGDNDAYLEFDLNEGGKKFFGQLLASELIHQDTRGLISTTLNNTPEMIIQDRAKILAHKQGDYYYPYGLLFFMRGSPPILLTTMDLYIPSTMTSSHYEAMHAASKNWLNAHVERNNYTTLQGNKIYGTFDFSRRVQVLEKPKVKYDVVEGHRFEHKLPWRDYFDKEISPSERDSDTHTTLLALKRTMPGGNSFPVMMTPDDDFSVDWQEFLGKYLEYKSVAGKEVSLVGGGSGVDVVQLFKAGAKTVYATDLFDANVLMTQVNVQFAKDLGWIVESATLYASRYNGIAGGEGVTLGLFNTPGINIDGEDATGLAMSSMAMSLEQFKPFFRDLHAFLKVAPAGQRHFALRLNAHLSSSQGGMQPTKQSLELIYKHIAAEYPDLEFASTDGNFFELSLKEVKEENIPKTTLLTPERALATFGDLATNPLLINLFNSLGQTLEGNTVFEDRSSGGKRAFMPFTLDEHGRQFFFDYLKPEIRQSVITSQRRTELLDGEDIELRENAIFPMAYILTSKNGARNIPYALLIYTAMGPIYLDMLELYNSPKTDPAKIQRQHNFVRVWVKSFLQQQPPIEQLKQWSDVHSHFVLTQFTRVPENLRTDHYSERVGTKEFQSPWYRATDSLDVFPLDKRDVAKYLTLFALERYGVDGKVMPVAFTPANPFSIDWQNMLIDLMDKDAQATSLVLDDSGNPTQGHLYADSGIGLGGIGTGVDAVLLARYGVKKIRGTDIYEAMVILARLNATFAKASGQVSQDTEFIFEYKSGLPSVTSDLAHFMMNTPAVIMDDDPAFSEVLENPNMIYEASTMLWSKFTQLFTDTDGIGDFLRKSVRPGLKSALMRMIISVKEGETKEDLNSDTAKRTDPFLETLNDLSPQQLRDNFIILSNAQLLARTSEPAELSAQPPAPGNKSRMTASEALDALSQVSGTRMAGVSEKLLTAGVISQNSGAFDLKPIQNEFERGIDEEEVVTFVAHVILAQGRTGDLVVADTLLSVLRDTEGQYWLEGFGGEARLIDSKTIVLNDRGDRAQVSMSMSDYQILFEQAERSMEPFFKGIPESITAIKVVEAFDLNILPSDNFATNLVYQIKRYIKERRSDPNFVVLFHGDSWRVDQAMAEVRDLPGLDQNLFVQDMADLPLEYLEDSANVRVVSIDGFDTNTKQVITPKIQAIGQTPTRHFVTRVLKKGELMHPAAHRVARLEARLPILGPDSEALFERFINAYETLLGRRIDNIDEFTLVLEGSVKVANFSTYVLPAFLRIDKILQVLRMATRMAAQSA